MGGSAAPRWADLVVEIRPYYTSVGTFSKRFAKTVGSVFGDPQRQSCRCPQTSARKDGGGDESGPELDWSSKKGDKVWQGADADLQEWAAATLGPSNWTWAASLSNTPLPMQLVVAHGIAAMPNMTLDNFVPSSLT